jgi:hypothetical protein
VRTFEEIDRPGSRRAIRRQSVSHRLARHGIVRVWAEDGTYIAVGSQTVSTIYIFDEGEPPFDVSRSSLSETSS